MMQTVTREINKEGLPLEDEVHSDLLVWTLKSLSELTSEQMGEFLYQVSQKGLSQLGEAVRG